MTISLSEFHNSLRELDRLVTIATFNPGDPNWMEAVRICAKNVGTAALYMLGRRVCSITGEYYFLDYVDLSSSLFLELEEVKNENAGTNDDGGSNGEKHNLPHLLRKLE